MSVGLGFAKEARNGDVVLMLSSDGSVDVTKRRGLQVVATAGAKVLRQQRT